MALCQPRSHLDGRVDKRQHNVDAVLPDNLVELGIHLRVGVTLAHNHPGNRGDRLLSVEFMAENAHVHAQLLAGARELLSHCHALGTAKHEYVYVPLNHCVEIKKIRCMLCASQGNVGL